MRKQQLIVAALTIGLGTLPSAGAAPGFPPHPAEFGGDWCRNYLRDHNPAKTWLGKYAATGAMSPDDRRRNPSYEACFPNGKACNHWLYVVRSGTTWGFRPDREFFAFCQKGY